MCKCIFNAEKKFFLEEIQDIVNSQTDEIGMHKSYNILEHGKFINDLNEINSRSENGFFFIDQHKNELFFKNQIDLNVASLEKNLDNLMKSNFRSIDFLIDLLKAKHNGRINFINY